MYDVTVSLVDFPPHVMSRCVSSRAIFPTQRTCKERRDAPDISTGELRDITLSLHLPPFCRSSVVAGDGGGSGNTPARELRARVESSRILLTLSERQLRTVSYVSKQKGCEIHAKIRREMHVNRDCTANQSSTRKPESQQEESPEDRTCRQEAADQ